MKDDAEPAPAAAGREPRRVRIPGFVSDEDIGLGDLVKRATHRMGIKPCGVCEERARALNRRIAFTGRRGRK
ncbi:hypothetical protein [Streptomyces litchfieldiae]|uniref:DksA C4-type domain-containing protein n=1 Tax=Streptomyces litchfieldiae TaxID=3075543 RepID=A0ABU2MVE2_9ACTN|nr:hypothetical protein [Streptomyces sp. DSM 44938]MDT0344514.1 hypothetical protein [Streptomyces sp. DSM 44938]